MTRVGREWGEREEGAKSCTTTNKSDSKYCEWIHLCVCRVQRQVRTYSVLACQCGSRAWEPGPVWVPGTSWSCHSSGEEEHPHQSPEEVITISTTECLLYTWNKWGGVSIKLVKICIKSGPKMTMILTNTAITETEFCEWCRVEAETLKQTLKNFTVKQ